MSPKIAIGLLLYNDKIHINETIISILNQTYKDYRMIISDDCSDDGSSELALKYAKQDERVSYYRNENRVGMLENYRVAFSRAGNDSDYFAWASGHDVYHDKWLEEMVNILEDNPDVVMAYCVTRRIGDNGEDLNISSPMFDNFGLGIKERIRSVCMEATGFGNMIYGLFRTETLIKAGVFPNLLLPDALLLMEISLYGSFTQSKSNLWDRRYWEHHGRNRFPRQRKALYQKAPWYSYLPYKLTHTAYLIWRTILRPGAGSVYKRQLGLRVILLFWLRHIKNWRNNLKNTIVDAAASTPALKKLYQLINKKMAD